MNYQEVLSSAAFWGDTKSNWKSIQFYLRSIAGSFSVISLLWHRFSLGSYHSLHTCMLSCFSHVWFFATLWTVAHQAPLSMGVSKQEYWSGLPFPLPGDLPSPGTELASRMSPALTGRFFTTEPPGKPSSLLTCTFTTNSFLVSLCPEYPPPIKHDLIDEGRIIIRHHLPSTLSPMPSFSVQFNSVTQSCPTLCDPMNRSTPGLPVHHQLPEFTQTHVHWVGDAIQPSHPLSSSSPPALNLSQDQGLFKWVSPSHQVAKVLEFQLQHQSSLYMSSNRVKSCTSISFYHHVLSHHIVIVCLYICFLLME